MKLNVQCSLKGRRVDIGRLVVNMECSKHVLHFAFAPV
jgi:hypothetical protein